MHAAPVKHDPEVNAPDSIFLALGPAIGDLLLPTSPGAVWWDALAAVLAGAVLLRLGGRSPRLRKKTVTAIDKPPLQDNFLESDAQARAALLSNLSYEVSLVLSDDPDAETFINIAARWINECTLNGQRLTQGQHGFNGNVLWLRGLCVC